MTPKEYKVVALRECATDKMTATSPQEVRDYWHRCVVSDDRFRGEVETLVCLMLNTRRRVTGHYVVATGTLDTLLAHAREVYRTAIVANASSIVLVHNHPSGDPSPSEADIKITRDLVQAGQLLKIELLDHVVMGDLLDGRNKDYASLRELGYFL